MIKHPILTHIRFLISYYRKPYPIYIVMGESLGYEEVYYSKERMSSYPHLQRRIEIFNYQGRLYLYADR